MNAIDLDTPMLYVDVDALERNIARMQARCRDWKVGLRPHIKTHKVPEIARRQLAAGALGITVAKVGEAEVMPGDDLLVAYPVTPAKLARLRSLARERRVTVVVDSVEGARALEDMPALVEVDVGIGRCGVSTPDQVVEVAGACARFRGLLYWPSWLDEAGFRRAADQIDACVRALETAGLAPEIVSGGSTPGAPHTPLVAHTTEIRPGTYVFHDVNSLDAGLCALEDCALRMLVQVVSTAVPGQCIVDGGSKTFSSDATIGAKTFGRFVDRPWRMEKMNEEHGYVAVDGPRPRAGEKVWVIPSHACATVNMHDEIAYGRGGAVEGVWRVAARGKVR